MYLNPLAPGGGTPGTPGSAGDTTADVVIVRLDFTHAVAFVATAVNLSFPVAIRARLASQSVCR